MTEQYFKGVTAVGWDGYEFIVSSPPQTVGQSDRWVAAHYDIDMVTVFAEDGDAVYSMSGITFEQAQRAVEAFFQRSGGTL